MSEMRRINPRGVELTYFSLQTASREARICKEHNSAKTALSLQRMRAEAISN
jgi:hypothetical protein